MIALCHFETHQEYRGTDTYARSLIMGLSKIDVENNYMIITNNIEPYCYINEHSNFLIYKVDIDPNEVQSVNTIGRVISPELLWMHSDLFQLIDQYKIEVFHFLGYVGLQHKRKDCNAKIITTAHGLEHEYVADMFHPKMVNMLKKAIPKSFQVANHIISVSNSVKKEIVKLYQTEEAKITVIHHGVPDIFRKKIQFMGFDYPYILYVGSGEYRKNIETLIKGFIVFKKKNQTSTLKLLMIGSGIGTFINAIDDNDIDIKKDIVYLGFVPPHELVPFFQNAFLFVNLSLYEGFGLVVSEALTCSVPVITSNIPIFREVVQESGLFINPYDYNSLAIYLERLITEKCFYKNLRNKASKMIDIYTANKMAIATKKIYSGLHK